MGRLLLPACEACALVLAAGCGFHSPAASTDGREPTCLGRWHDGTVRLEPPLRIAEIGSPQSERDPYPTSDELTIYFSTYRAGTQNGDVFAARRSAIGEAFGSLQRQDSSSDAVDSRFTMTADELVAIVASNRGGTEGASDVWIASRGSKTASFSSFGKSGMADVDTGGEELDPELSADGLHLYLASGVPQRIALAVRSSREEPFGAARPIAELVSGTNEADPSVSPDELIIVFSSRRGGGADDLWYATRSTPTALFGTPVLVPTVNANGFIDGDPALSPDGCRLYFASDRSGDFELYVASVTP